MPIISEGPYSFEHVNVATQRRDPNSFLNWTERIIRMRKELPEIGWGDFVVIRTGTPQVFALRYDWRNESVLFVHNLSPIPREVFLMLTDVGESGCVLVNVLSDDHSDAAESGKHRVLLEPYGYRWYRVGGVDPVLQRTGAK
jgi:maltose alpha-D-glucosyltransferase/alpha-amylase